MANRRELLGALSAITIGIAGCLDGDGPAVDRGEPPASDAPDEDGVSPESAPVPNADAYDFPPPDEPADPPATVRCGVCNMTPADWPEANAQVVHENEHRQFFCSPGCLVAYVVAPEEFSRTESPILAGWARDVETTALHRMETVYWVLDPSPDPHRGIDPMSNPLPYRTRSEAIAYVEQWDDLEEADVVEFGELDRETARGYRALEG